jgi:hypothetical protein
MTAATTVTATTVTATRVAATAVAATAMAAAMAVVTTRAVAACAAVAAAISDPGQLKPLKPTLLTALAPAAPLRLQLLKHALTLLLRRAHGNAIETARSSRARRFAPLVALLTRRGAA